MSSIGDIQLEERRQRSKICDGDCRQSSLGVTRV
jgi:hypothetical protein